MKKLLLSFLIASALMQGCQSQPKAPSKQIFNSLFNWHITIPEGFTSVPAAEWNRMQNRGADAIERTYDTKVENRAKTVFVFKSDDMNYFESNYQPYDAATDGEYLENFKGVNDVVYGTFEAQMPNARLDSNYSQETIDGKVFQTFEINITLPNGLVLQWMMYCRLFGRKEFTVNMMTIDKERRRLLLEAWRASTFSGNEKK